LKYPPGEAVSNFPLWKWQMGGGMVLAVLVFAAGWLTLRRRPWTPRLSAWIAIAVSATTGGILLGVAADKMYYESYGFGGWLGWGALLAAGILSPLLCANALIAGRPLPTFLELLGPRDYKTKSLLPVLLGLVLIVTALIAAETALGFVFDPRYRDFPFASLSMCVLPFATVMLLNRPKQGTRPISEAVFAGVLALSAVYTAFNEGSNNWQSLWTCAIYLLLALTLWQARVARSPE
jgi:glucan 1,3-beta-glucosidase